MSNIYIEGNSAGRIPYAQDWEFENVTIKTADNSKLNVEDSSDMNL